MGARWVEFVFAQRARMNWKGGGVLMGVSRGRRLLVGPLVVVLGFIVGGGQAWAGTSTRGYEQVSPLFKGGYGAKEIVGVRPDGESVVFASFGAFAGDLVQDAFNYYQADRASSDWVTLALNPPAALSPLSFTSGFSPSLDSSLWILRPRAKNKALASDLSDEDQFSIEVGGVFQAAGPALSAPDKQPVEIFEEGVSDNFCHVVLSTLNTSPLVSEAVGHESQIYDVDTCEASAGNPKLVAVTNSGALLAPDCLASVGASRAEKTNAVSADGNTVYFEAQPECKGSEQLFVRVGGEKTLEVSKPLESCVEVPCSGAGAQGPAHFRGASEDGSRVFFTTTSKLDPSTDSDNANDLYMATIGCPSSGECESSQRIVTSVVQVSQDPTLGEAAEVQGVVGLSNDGSHAYFVAHGVLGEEGSVSEGAQVRPVSGADNLYSYENDARYPRGHAVFIGDICTGPNLSGEVSDVRCPDDLASGGGGTVKKE